MITNPPGESAIPAVDRVAEAGAPRPAVALPEPVPEEQHEVVVVGSELPVLQRLAVVGIGAGVEEQLGEGEGVRMLGLAASLRPRAPVSAVNGVVSPCHRYPALGSAPWASRSRAAARVASGLMGRDEAGVGQVQQRLPVRYGLPCRARPGSAVRSAVQGGHVGHGRRHVHAAAGELGVLGQERTSASPAGRRCCRRSGGRRAKSSSAWRPWW